MEESEAEEVLDLEAGTVRCAANYAPLSPISFIERAAAVYGARAAVVYGERRHTWAEARDRCARVAAALATRFGVARRDVVSEADPHDLGLLANLLCLDRVPACITMLIRACD
jgi:non-ribosomal peptide synthetase component E (peptide arylation enzyme)